MSRFDPISQDVSTQPFADFSEATRELQKFYEPIGDLVVAFSQLELTVMLLIAGLLRVDPNIGMALLSEMSFAKRLDALQSIAPYTIRDERLRSELTVVVARLSESECQRNTIVHTTWMLSGRTAVARFKPTARAIAKNNFRFAKEKAGTNWHTLVETECCRGPS